MQVLRVAQSDADVTVFFHPNVADAELSADASASFVCEFLEPQVHPCSHQYLHASSDAVYLSATCSGDVTVSHLELPVQDAAEFVAGLRSVLEQFAHAMLHIGQGYTLQEKAEILAITQGPLTKARDLWRKGKTSPGQAAETVIARAPEWETDHAMPASWTLPGVSDACTEPRDMHFLTWFHTHNAREEIGEHSPVALSKERQKFSSDVPLMHSAG